MSEILGLKCEILPICQFQGADMHQKNERKSQDGFSKSKQNLLEDKSI